MHSADAQRAGVPPAVADHELAEQHFDEPRLEVNPYLLAQLVARTSLIRHACQGPSKVEEGKELHASPTSAKENVRPVDWTSPSPDQKQVSAHSGRTNVTQR